jgi:uncharacterized phage infection (PIP) family protein YhgE
MSKMSICEYCGKESNLLFICAQCGKRFCKEHRNHESHIDLNQTSELVETQEKEEPADIEFIEEVKEIEEPFEIELDEVTQEVEQESELIEEVEEIEEPARIELDDVTHELEQESELTEEVKESVESDVISETSSKLAQSLEKGKRRIIDTLSRIEFKSNAMIAAGIILGILGGVFIGGSLELGNDQLSTEIDVLQDNYDELKDRYSELLTNYSRQNSEYESLKTEQALAQIELDKLQESLDTLNDEYSSLESEFGSIKQENQVLQEELSKLADIQKNWEEVIDLEFSNTDIPTVSQLRDWLQLDNTNTMSINDDLTETQIALILSLSARERHWKIGILSLRGTDSLNENFEATVNVINLLNGPVYINPLTDEVWWYNDFDEINIGETSNLGAYGEIAITQIEVILTN